MANIGKLQSGDGKNGDDMRKMGLGILRQKCSFCSFCSLGVCVSLAYNIYYIYIIYIIKVIRILQLKFTKNIIKDEILTNICGANSEIGREQKEQKEQIVLKTKRPILTFTAT